MEHICKDLNRGSLEIMLIITFNFIKYSLECLAFPRFISLINKIVTITVYPRLVLNHDSEHIYE